MIPMIPKLLAWISFAMVIVAAGLALTAVFGGSAVGALAPSLVLYGSIPVLALAILLAVAILLLGAFQS
ncbi:MAG: hypothetical protein DWH79_07030 [Planctomycetota bacterium]|nr:MAG: hypothetical protein DWH79_07030 [Planctomycetota bacterium]